MENAIFDHIVTRLNTDDFVGIEEDEVLIFRPRKFIFHDYNFCGLQISNGIFYVVLYDTSFEDDEEEEEFSEFVLSDPNFDIDKQLEYIKSRIISKLQKMENYHDNNE